MSEEAEVLIGGHISAAARFKVTQFDKPATRQAIEVMQNAVKNRAQYLRRKHGYEFELNLVDAVTADREHIVVTFIATRMK